MKILLTLWNTDIAPRFDLTTEVLIVETDTTRAVIKSRNILLPGSSADELCSLILKEEIAAVICGGIEEAHFQYLVWKKIRVIDRVIGAQAEVLQLALADKLRTGAIVPARTKE